jgi:hypothetical protein
LVTAGQRLVAAHTRNSGSRCPGVEAPKPGACHGEHHYADSGNTERDGSCPAGGPQTGRSSDRSHPRCAQRYIFGAKGVGAKPRGDVIWTPNVYGERKTKTAKNDEGELEEWHCEDCKRSNDRSDVAPHGRRQP